MLKPTGSLYLHCDPTASHYLKILLDAVFGAERSAAGGRRRQGFRRRGGRAREGRESARSP
ncbi:hypothetical protein BH23PSE1_BH23PSE1_05030 [soil metagenome]